MDTNEHFFSESLQKLKDYCNDRVLLLKLKTVEKTSEIVANIVSIILLSIFGCFILVFLSISAAFFFASQTHSNTIGFAIVAGIYLVFFLAIFIGGKKFIQRRIINSVIRYSFKESKEEKEEENEESETNNQPG